MTYRCIKPANLPPRLPLGSTALVWLLLDRFAVTGLWAGVAWTLMALWWIIALVALINYEPIDVIGSKQPAPTGRPPGVI